MKEIRWRLHLNSDTKKVFEFLSSEKARSKYWAESAIESNDHIAFVFINGFKYRSKILSSSPNSEFTIEYFNTIVKFELTNDGNGGTDLTLTNSGVPDEEYLDMFAGWLSVLLALKAACDFDIDLRNHDKTRTWDQGFVDN